MTRLADLGLAHLRPVERRVQIERLASAAGVTFDEVLRSMPMGRKPRDTDAGEEMQPQRDLATCKLSDTEYLIACALAEPSLAAALRSAAPPTPSDPRTAVIYGAIIGGGGERGLSFEDPAVAGAAAALARRVTSTAGEALAEIEALFNQTAERIRLDRADAKAAGGTAAERLAAIRDRGRSAVSGPAGVPWGRRKPPA
jgi:hypothetical protein